MQSLTFRLSILEADCSAVKDIYDIIDEFKKRPAQPLALATLVRVEGSSYRRLAARMLICEGGTRAGSLSAGIHTTLGCANVPALLK